MYILNGKKLHLGQAFTVGEGLFLTQYPSNWLALSTADDRSAIGIIEEADPAMPDQRFFDAIENKDGSITSTPRPQEKIIAVFEAALDDHLDSVARQYRYRDRFTFSIRSTRPGPWYEQGCAFYDWMEVCNTQAYSLLEQVKVGTVPMPTVESFIDGLPTFVLP